jgi:hypothetical protein
MKNTVENMPPYINLAKIIDAAHGGAIAMIHAGIWFTSLDMFIKIMAMLPGTVYMVLKIRKEFFPKQVKDTDIKNEEI